MKNNFLPVTTMARQFNISKVAIYKYLTPQGELTEAGENYIKSLRKEL